MATYKRVLLKLGGEIFGKKEGKGIAFSEYQKIGQEIISLQKKHNVEMAIVVGAGNIFRGREFEGTDFDPVVADNMGMLSTIINAIALQEAIERLGGDTRVMTSVPIPSVAEPFIRRKAIRHLEKGRIVILGGGTGNPFFTTDSAAALRASELDCDVILKGTNVDGVYDKDPHQHPDAVKFSELTYQEAIEKRLNVMDSTAFALCREKNIPIIVFNTQDTQAIDKIIGGGKIGTLIRE